MHTDNRIVELLQLAEQEGITLPWSPQFICEMEDSGHIVDFHTGAILIGEGVAVVIELTIQGYCEGWGMSRGEG